MSPTYSKLITLHKGIRSFLINSMAVIIGALLMILADVNVVREFLVSAKVNPTLIVVLVPFTAALVEMIRNVHSQSKPPADVDADKLAELIEKLDKTTNVLSVRLDHIVKDIRASGVMPKEEETAITSQLTNIATTLEHMGMDPEVPIPPVNSLEG